MGSVQFSWGGASVTVIWAAARFVTSEEFLSKSLVAAGEAFECLIRTEVFFDSPQSIDLLDIRKLEMRP